jgi:hypothetical protein
MVFTGNEDHSISLEEAARLTKNYRESPGAGAFLGGYVSKSAILNILNQESCTGIRIYNAKTGAEDLTFVLVGVNSEGEDLAGGELAEFVSQCPPYCPVSSELAGTG